MKIIFPEYLDNLSDEHKQQLQQFGDVTFYEDFPNDDKELIKRLHGAQITALKWVNMTDKTVHSLPELKYVITLSAGYAHLPLKAMKERQVIGINCPTHNSLAVAEHTIAMLFALLKNIVESQILLQKGLWKKTPYDYLGTEIYGKTICVIGNGNIGSKVAALAKGLGMHVENVNSKTSSEELDRLVHKSDFISINLPYSKETHHLFDKKRLQQMKKGAVLINTSRGLIIDQQALFDLLQTGHLGGAALDVFVNEPVFTTTLPKEIQQLASLPNVIATPHIAYNTKEAAYRLIEELIANIKAILAEKPINVVE